MTGTHPRSQAQNIRRRVSRVLPWGKMGMLFCWSVYLGGVVWRYLHCFHWHPATSFIYKSMRDYVGRAKRMWDPNYTETVGDIIFPPGGHIHIGLSYYFDHTLELAMVVQFVQSVLLPLILAMIGYELYGRRVAFVTLVLASIYYPFIDYAAYFMTEGPYVFYLALSMWLLIRSLRVGSAKVGLLFALLAGVMLGITAAFKTVVLACSAMIFLQLSLVAYRSKWCRPAILLAGSTVGLLVLVIPMTIRATRINDGKLTPISTNGALTVLMGHSGEIGTFHFNDRKRRRTYWFGSPAANQRGYKKQLSLPYGPWDSSEMLRDAWRWTRENPAAAFRLSCQNVLDLFQGSLAFPSVGEPRWKPWMYWFQRFYWIFILLPSLVHLAFNFRRLSDMQGPGLADSLLLLPLLGLMAVSFFTIGQPRYRIPFDAFQILLAARWYTGGLARRDGLVPWRERTGEKASHAISEAPDRGQPMASHRLQTRFGLAAVAVAFVVALLFSETPEADRREPQRRRPAAQATPKLSSIVAPNVVLQNTLVGHESYVTGVAFSPDGQLLATSSYDNTVRLWDVVTAQLQQTYDGHEGYVRAVRFAPDGRVLASCSNDGTIRLWDVAQGNCLITLTGHDGPVRDVAFSPDGTILASGGKDRSVRLWNVKEGTLEQTLEGHRSWVNCLVFSPDGYSLASASRAKRIILWDVATRQAKKQIEAHADHVYSIAISPDGLSLASTGMDKLTKVWTLPDGRLKVTLRGHEQFIEAVAFSPDSQMLATGSRDEKIILWDVAGRRILRTLDASMGRVTSVTFSPNGSVLAAAGQNGEVKLWKLTWTR